MANKTIPAIQTNEGKVGIGTTSPAANLHVTGQTYLTNVVASVARNQLTINTNGANYAHFYDVGVIANNAIAIGGNGAIATVPTKAIMTWRLSTENVGIGLTNPEASSALHIKNTDAAAKVTIESADASESFINFSAQSSEYSVGFVRDGSNVNSLRFCAADGLSAGEVMRLQNTNVGIGTTVPTYRLDIEGVSTTSVVQNVRNPSTAWTQYALTRYQTDVKDSRYVDVGYFRGAGAEATRGFVISGLNSNILTLLDIVGGYNLGLGGVPVPLYNIDVASTQGKGIQLRYDTSTGYRAQITPYWNSSTDTRIDFAINRTANVVADVIMSVGYGSKVGIGTTAPTGTLTIQSNSNQLRLQTATGPGAYFTNISSFYDSTHPFAIEVANNSSSTTEYFGIYSDAGGANSRPVFPNGNVGIGTTRPSGKLTVQGNIEVNYNSTTADTSVRRSFLTTHATINRGANITFGLFDGGSNPMGMTVYNVAAAAGAYNSQFITFYTHEGGVSEGERMRITQLGDVGIGTFTPLSLLTVGEAGSTSAAKGLSFGGDASANLYRSAASTIKTDGSLEVTTSLNIGADLYVADELGVGVLIANKRVNYGAQISAASASIQLVLGRTASATGQGAIGADSANTFAVWNVSGGFTKQLVVTQQGNVGIGADTPNAKLQIAGTTASLLTVGTLTNDWGGVVAIGTIDGNGIILSKVNTANDTNRVLTLMRDDTNGASIFGYTPVGTSTSVGFQIRASASSYFNGGNVGIGITNPLEKLHVTGYILTRSKLAYTQTHDIVKNGLSFYVDFNNKTCFDANISSTSIKDLSNNGYTLNLVNVATIGNKDGNTALYTANNASYLQIVSYVIALPHTWEAWVNGDAFSSWDTIWDSNTERPLIGAFNGVLQVYPNATNCGTLAAGKWYHIVVTANASSVVVTYINGIQTATFAYGSTFRTGTGDYWLGGDTGGETFNGYIPIARTYNRVLSATEVMQNYNIEKWRFDSSSTFYHNVADGNVGIGTTNPTQKLDIVGSYGAPDDNAGILKIRGAGVGPTQLNFGVSADGGYGWIQATDISIDNDRDIILGPLGGDVGIGTTNPLSLLTVGAAGSTTAAKGLSFGGDASANLYRLAAGQVKTDGQLVAVGGFYSVATAGNYIETLNIGTAVIIEGGVGEGLFLGDSSRWMIGTSDAAYTANADGDLHFRDNTNSVTRMIINYASGFVGIGTTSPAAKLDVVGTIRLSSNLLSHKTASYTTPYPGISSFGADATDSSITYYDTGKTVPTTAIAGVVWTGKHYIFTSYASLAYFYDNNFNLITNSYGFNSLSLPRPSGYSYPHGAAWDGRYLWTVCYVDGETVASKIVGYDLDGPSGNAAIIAESAPLTSITAAYDIEYADGHLYIVRSGNVYIYRWNGSTIDLINTILGEAGSITAQAITYDGSWLWVTQDNQYVYKLGLDGYQEAVITSGFPPSIAGWAWNGSNIVTFNRSTLNIYIINTTRLRIDTRNLALMGGNVGIGTTNPLAPLHVGLGGDWPSSTGTSAMVFIKQKSSNVGLVIQEPGNASFDRALHLYTNGSLATIDATYRDTGPYPDIAFVTSGTERVRINSAGNVLIRTTTSTTNGGLLQIGQVPNTTASSIGFNNEDNAVISAKYNLVFQIDNTNSVASRAYEWNKGGKGYGDGTNLMTLNAAGKLGIGTASPTTLLSVGGAGSTSAASGITFGGDAEVNLYRVAENVLQTDAALNVVGSIYSASYFYTAVGQIYGSTYGNLTFFVGNSAGNAWQEGMFIKRGSYVGIGTTNPTGKLHIVSSVAGETVLRADGTNGTLFSVVDDLSDSLMSVNNSAGLPVLEVFADDRVVAGQYGSGDFVLINNKVGLGTSNPANKLSVIGGASIGSSTYNVAAPSNGLIVEGNVGIGTTNPSYKLDVIASVTDVGRFCNNQTTLVLNVGSTNNTEYTDLQLITNNGNAQFFKNRASASWGGADSLNIYTSNGAITFHPAGTQNAVYIDSNGNVGIGSAGPSSKLDVYGGTLTVATKSSYALAVGNANTDLTFGANASNAYIQSWSSKPLYINNQGNNTIIGADVGIGNVTPSAARLHIKTDNTNPALRIEDPTILGPAGGTAAKNFAGWLPIMTGAAVGDKVFIPLFK